jgi:hypothetical protein
VKSKNKEPLVMFFPQPHLVPNIFLLDTQSIFPKCSIFQTGFNGTQKFYETLMKSWAFCSVFIIFKNNWAEIITFILLYSPDYTDNCVSNTSQNYWVSGLCPSFRILNTRKHNVSETASVSFWRGEGYTYSVAFLRKS